MADIDIKITEVENRLHELNMGLAEVEVSYNGRLVKFTPTDIGKLETYLAKLIVERDGISRRGAIGITF